MFVQIFCPTVHRPVVGDRFVRPTLSELIEASHWRTFGCLSVA